MNALVNTEDNTNPLHTNNALAAAANAALGTVAPPVEDSEEQTKKEKKKHKKKLKKALAREREEQRERLDAAHPRADATPLTDLGKTPATQLATPISGQTSRADKQLDRHSASRRPNACR